MSPRINLNIRQLLLLCLFILHGNVSLYSAKDDDIPSLQVQYDVINKRNYVSSNNELIQLRDNSIKALIDWCREFTKNERKTLVFNKPTDEAYIGINPDMPFKHQQTDIDTQSALYEKEHPFSDFPMYECVDVKKLLKEPSYLFQVDMSMVNDHVINISITAIIPVTPEDSVDYKFFTTTFSYEYTLDLLGEDESINQRYYLVGLLKDNVESFYIKQYERAKQFPRYFLKDFKWKLLRINCSHYLREHKVSEYD